MPLETIHSRVINILDLFPVGYVIDGFFPAPPSYLPLAGGTIGNASSGATVRANADTLALYTTLWNNVGNTQLPVGRPGTYTRTGTTVTVNVTAHGFSNGNSVTITFTSGGATATVIPTTYTISGVTADTFNVTTALSGTITTSNLILNVASRGADALTDFNANRTIQLPDTRGRARMNTNDGVGSSLTGRVAGVSVGSEAHSLTFAQMPYHNHGGGSHTHLVGHNSSLGAAQDTNRAWSLFSSIYGWDYNSNTPNQTVVPAEGSNGSFQIMQPSIAIPSYIKYL